MENIIIGIIAVLITVAWTAFLCWLFMKIARWSVQQNTLVQVIVWLGMLFTGAILLYFIVWVYVRRGEQLNDPWEKP